MKKSKIPCGEILLTEGEYSFTVPEKYSFLKQDKINRRLLLETKAGRITKKVIISFEVFEKYVRSV